jgi:hypothetical protein
MSAPEPDRLEELLNAAGQAVQPTVFGWQALPARLTQLPQALCYSLGRWSTLPVGIAAIAAVIAVAVMMFWPRPPLHAQDLPIEVRRESIDLTILSITETAGPTLYMPLAAEPPARRQKTGQALVKDRRLVLNLKTGDNVVRFTEVAATIDPTSVRFESLTDPKGTTVVEQSFEYDLATADALLRRFIDREIICIDRENNEIAGYLASYDIESLVLATAPAEKQRQTQTVSRLSLQAIRLSEKPAGLLVKPTLVWKLRTTTPGQHKTMLSYLCGEVKWHADYVAELKPGQGGGADTLDLSGLVTVENTCGSVFAEAKLRVLAGNVRRLVDTWSKGPTKESMLGRTHDGLQVEFFDLGEDSKLGEVRAFTEQSLFEYHLYALNLPVTIGDRQIKQLKLLNKTGIIATRRYIFDPVEGQRHLLTEVLAKNEKDNQLGMPLPAGKVVIEQRGTDGETALIGQADLDHLAAKEELKLRCGRAFDLVGEHRELVVEKLNQSSRITYEMQIRNHKPTPAAIKCYGVPLQQGAVVREASAPYQVEDASKFYFEFTLAPNEERTIRYTIVHTAPQK